MPLNVLWHVLATSSTIVEQHYLFRCWATIYNLSDEKTPFSYGLHRMNCFRDVSGVCVRMERST